MKRLMLLVLAVGLLASGCTTVQKGVAIGGAAGAAVGGVWGANAGSLSAGEGALVGGAGGGLVGALIGDQLEKVKKEDLEREIENLKSQLDAKERALAQKDADLRGKDANLKELERQLAALKDSLAQKERELKDLEDRIKDLELELERTPKGITLTIADRLLFVSGSAEITEEGKQILDRVAEIIKEKFPGRELNIEGHTDNEPITYSGWKSNWELGAARSLSVLHYLVDKHGVAPEKISATTYGEFRAVADNATKEGMGENRRAVVVILPEIQIEKVELE